MAESMKGLKRTHRCGELSAANVGEKVTIMGWVQKNRNKGGLVFTDVRDRSGIIQVVCEEGKTDAALLEKLGVNIYLNSEITDISMLKNAGYTAVILAVGASEPGRLKLEKGNTRARRGH